MIKLPPPPARQAQGKPPTDPRRQRIETERQRRADYARLNVASALKLRGVY